MARLRYRKTHGHLNDEYLLTRDVIRAYHIQNKLAPTVDGIIGQVWGYPHNLTRYAPPREKDRNEICRGVMRAIWEGDPPPVADLVLDAQWREAFEAEEELLRRLRSIPPAEHARLIAGLAQDGAPMAEDAERTLASEYGVFLREAFDRAIGPTPEYVDVLTDEKYDQRCGEIYLRFETSEEGYAVKLALEALVARHPEILEGWRKVRIPRNSDE
jgi:hypothetical protein